MGTWVGAIATILGFAAALYQIRRATSAAEATAQAVTATSRQLALNQAAALHARLVRAQLEIDRRVEADEHAGVRRAMSDWQEAAIELRGTLVAAGIREKLLSVRLARTMRMVQQSREALLDDSRSCAEASLAARGAIDGVMLEVGTLMGTQRFATPGEDS